MDSKLKNDFNKTNGWGSKDIQSLLNMAGKQSKLIGLFVIAMVILNFPLLGVFARSTTIGGIPSVFVYLFVVWLGIILIMRQSVESRKRKDKKEKNKDDQSI